MVNACVLRQHSVVLHHAACSEGSTRHCCGGMPHTFAAPAYIGKLCKFSEVAHKIAKVALHLYSFSCAVSTIQSGGDTLMILHQRQGHGEPIMLNDAFNVVVLVEKQFVRSFCRYLMQIRKIISGIVPQPGGRHAISTCFAHAIYSEFHMSRVQIPPVPVFPRASAFSAGTTKVKHSTLLAQANTSSSHTQPCSHRIHQQVQILPPKSKGGGANTGS